MVGSKKNVALVTLERPDKPNALDMPMFEAVRDGRRAGHGKA